MKRSEINAVIKKFEALLAEYKFAPAALLKLHSGGVGREGS